MPAAAPHFFNKRWSVVRSIGRFCLDRKIGPGEGSADLQPGAERPSFLTHQMVMAGRPAKLTPQTSGARPPQRLSGMQWPAFLLCLKKG